ncbi:MAG: hypothetical protein LRZ85_03990 [Alphaproteobacteria bacterium]|nr:hypothetical protein [Alphaproteobacteria bacterium]
MSGKTSDPATIESTLDNPAGPGIVLPVGVTRYEQPLSLHDYVMADPMNQAAIDTILYDIICKTRQDMGPGARLYVVIGENHASPVPRMTLAGIMDNMAADARHGALLLGSGLIN